MIKCVNYWMIGGFEGNVSIEEAAGKAKQCGYDAIELVYGPGYLGPSTTERELATIKGNLDRMELQVSSLCTASYWETSLTADDEQERNQALRFSEAYIRAAAALGVDAVLLIPGVVDVCWGGAPRPPVPAATVHERARVAIGRLVPLAEELEVTIAVENVWNKFLTGPFELSTFVDLFGSPRVKAYFDVGNCLINGYPEHWIEILGDRIARVHVKNFTRRDGGGTLADFTPSLLDGDVNWAAVFAALKKIGYDSYLTAEVVVGENGMPDIDQAKRVGQEMTELVETHTK